MQKRSYKLVLRWDSDPSHKRPKKKMLLFGFLKYGNIDIFKAELKFEEILLNLFGTTWMTTDWPSPFHSFSLQPIHTCCVTMHTQTHSTLLTTDSRDTIVNREAHSILFLSPPLFLTTNPLLKSVQRGLCDVGKPKSFIVLPSFVSQHPHVSFSWDLQKLLLGGLWWWITNIAQM